MDAYTHLSASPFFFTSIQIEKRSCGLLFAILERVLLVDARSVVGRISAECGFDVSEERVHAGEQRLWSIADAVDGRGAGVHDDFVSQVRRHYEVMLHDEGCLARMQDKPLRAKKRQHN
jgi:hypothetical protein